MITEPEIIALGEKTLNDLTLYEVLKYTLSQWDEREIHRIIGEIKKDKAGVPARDRYGAPINPPKTELERW